MQYKITWHQRTPNTDGSRCLEQCLEFWCEDDVSKDVLVQTLVESPYFMRHDQLDVETSEWGNTIPYAYPYRRKRDDSKNCSPPKLSEEALQRIRGEIQRRKERKEARLSPCAGHAFEYCNSKTGIVE